MKQVSEMPTSGQFVAVYQYNGEILSDVLHWDDGLLISSMLDDEITQEGIDEFLSEYPENQCKYFIAD